MSSPAPAVLCNDDLLGLILEYTPRSDVPNIRLCNKAICDAASPFLFRTLLISPRKRHLRRLNFVLNHEQFKLNVREFVWETTAYGCVSEPPADDMIEDDVVLLQLLIADMGDDIYDDGVYSDEETAAHGLIYSAKRDRLRHCLRR